MNVQHEAGEFDGLVACITGGSSGIGLATAHAARGAWCRVELLDLRAPADARGSGNRSYPV